MYTFGKHGESQLGRSAEGEGGGAGKGQEAEVWHLSPGLIPSLGDSCKVVWLGARSNQTFVAVNESLVSNHNLRKCGVLIIFAHKNSSGMFHIRHGDIQGTCCTKIVVTMTT